MCYKSIGNSPHYCAHCGALHLVALYGKQHFHAVRPVRQAKRKIFIFTIK
jgi:hypothetical protein